MLVYIEKHLVEIGDNVEESRGIIAVFGKSLREQIKNTRHLGIEIDKMDEALLGLLLKIIAHNMHYSDQETIEQKKATLYNISRTATAFSKEFKSKYIDSNQRSIWRELEYLHKMVIPDGQSSEHVNYFISDNMVKKILYEALVAIREIALLELNADLGEEDKQSIREECKDTCKSPNLYSMVNYYREIESLEKILDILPDDLNTLDLSTLEGKCTIFRILEILGEYVSQKNITPSTRLLDADLNWDLLVAVRNRLAHHEWYLSEKRGAVLDRLFNFELTKVVHQDMPFIRLRLGIILNYLRSFEQDKLIHEKLFDRRISDHFKPREELKFELSDDAKYSISNILEWFFTNGYIDDEQKKSFYLY